MTTDQKNMRAWRVHRLGDILDDNLSLETIPRPSADSLTKNQVLVRTSAAALNPADYKLLRFPLANYYLFTLPKTPGMDFSGRVVATGSDITHVKTGDRVFCWTHPLVGTQGALAEYISLDGEGVVAIPDSVSFEDAAGVPTGALSAYQSIAPYVKSEAGDWVFINGGSGGVGTYCVQIAKVLGCRVVASCSTSKVQLCKELGADEVIDYKTEDLSARVKELGKEHPFALVVDNVGNLPADFVSAADEALRSDGRFIRIGGQISLQSAKSNLLPKFLGGSQHFIESFITRPSKDDLAKIASWMGEGKVETVVEETFEFEKTVDAYKALKTGSSKGKIVVQVRTDESQAFQR